MPRRADVRRLDGADRVGATRTTGALTPHPRGARRDRVRVDATPPARRRRGQHRATARRRPRGRVRRELCGVRHRRPSSGRSPRSTVGRCVRPPAGADVARVGAEPWRWTSTDARFVAKFDDDDLYGPDLPRRLAPGARLRGCRGRRQALVLRPARRDRRHATSGFPATSSATRARWPVARWSSIVTASAINGFDDISLGEDRAFLARCHRRGISTFRPIGSTSCRCEPARTRGRSTTRRSSRRSTPSTRPR